MKILKILLIIPAIVLGIILLIIYTIKEFIKRDKYIVRNYIFYYKLFFEEKFGYLWEEKRNQTQRRI